jgi:SAM-dependent methyltransferase
MNEPTLGSAQYFRTRFVADAHRDDVWERIVPYLERWIPVDAAIVDVGAGYCSFINAVTGRRRIAVDQNPASGDFAADGVEFVCASALALDALDDADFDVVFASNLLEHLDRAGIAQALLEFRRILRPDGRLLLIQPNYRLCSARYWDDYTHVTPLSDVSLADFVGAAGFTVRHLEARFMPFSLKSRLGGLAPLIPFYLRLPWRPLAAQMLLVASPAP